MIGWILAAIGGLGSVGAIAACLLIPGASGVLLGFARGAWAFLKAIPWQVYAIGALAALIAFLVISRGHWIDRAHGDEAREALVCKAVRDVAGRPRQNCELNELQIRAFGKSIQDLEAAVREQNSKIQELGRKSAALQAEAAQAKEIAAKRADEAESVARRADASAKIKPAQPCSVSKFLEEQWP